jgi:hypothetical protein
MPKRKPTSAEIRTEILARIRNGVTASIEIRSGDVRADLGGENSVCSNVMKNLFRAGDAIVELPAGRQPSNGDTFEKQTVGQNHKGGNLVIRYRRATDRNKPA